MTDSALSSDHLERYSAIEKAYCDERWSSVVQDGQTLLAAISGAEAVPEGLKERVELLMAHAHLYGFGDRDSAEDLYQLVLRSGCEASLRQIAMQGLRQCSQPLQAPTVVVQPQSSGLEPPPASAPIAPEGPPVSRPEPPSEPPSEPSTPTAASGRSTPVAEPLGLWSIPAEALTTPTASPQAPASAPVMPWLAAPAGPAVEPTTPLADPTETSLPPAAEVIAPVQASSWMVEEPQAGSAADVQQGSAAAESLEAPAAEMLAPVVAPAEDPVPGLTALIAESSTAGEASDQVSARWEEPLVPEVLEEPEQIEVLQADPRRVEEVELSVRESLPPADFQQGLGAVPPAAVVSAPSHLSLVKDNEPESAAVEPLPTSPASSPVAVGRGPFAGSPQAVAFEDPELLEGLLRVEMG